AIPAAAKALVLNITAVSPSTAGYLTAYPDGLGQPPRASDVNFIPGQIVPNLTVVLLSSAGAFDVFNASGTVDVIADVQGWYQ
nr:hypothetical protein [Actinomycetota bacterium]